MKLKKMLTILSLLLAMSLVVAQPAMAANPLESFTSSLKSRFSRLFLQFPGDKPAKAVLEQSVVAMNNLKTAQTNAEIVVVMMNNQDQEALTGKLTMAGPTEIKDIYDPTTAKQDLKVMGEMTMQGTTLKADVEVKLDGEVVYFNAHQLPALPYFDLSKIQNQWLKLDPSTQPEAQRRERREITIEMRQKMQQAFNELVGKSQLSQAHKEKLAGHNVFAIEMAVPDSAIQEYLDKVAEIEEIPAEERAQTQESVKKSLEAMEDLKAKVWIDRSNFFVRQFEAPMVFDMQKIAADQRSEMTTANQTPFGSLDEMKTLKVTVSGTMDHYNEPVSFSAPTEARDFQEVMNELMQQMGGPAATMPANQKKLQTMPKIPASELKGLSPEERKILQQYGIDPDNL